MKQALPFLFALTLAACSADPDNNSETADSLAPPDVMKLSGKSALFDPASLAEPIKKVDCTLSGGTQTDCLSITLKPEPAFFKIGPWCPRHIEDGPDVSGIWLEGGKVYDTDGAFIQNLPAFYQDSSWQLFDPDTGKINVTDTKISCEAAARPDVDPAYQNHCVECQVSYMEDGASQTYVIPLDPVPAKSGATRVSRSGVGVAFSGVRLDASAPTDAILSAYTLAPFDDCGGHVNLNVGYHMHAVTEAEGCHKHQSSINGHAPQIGLAMDGYPIHARLNAAGEIAQGLDACLGHETDDLPYHYHTNDPGANAILTCHTGETGCAQDSSDELCVANQETGRRGPPGDRPARGERPPQ